MRATGAVAGAVTILVMGFLLASGSPGHQDRPPPAISLGPGPAGSEPAGPTAAAAAAAPPPAQAEAPGASGPSPPARDEPGQGARSVGARGSTPLSAAVKPATAVTKVPHSVTQDYAGDYDRQEGDDPDGRDGGDGGGGGGGGGDRSGSNSGSG